MKKLVGKVPPLNELLNDEDPAAAAAVITLRLFMVVPGIVDENGMLGPKIKEALDAIGFEGTTQRQRAAVSRLLREQDYCVLKPRATGKIGGRNYVFDLPKEMTELLREIQQPGGEAAVEPATDPSSENGVVLARIRGAEIQVADQAAKLRLLSVLLERHDVETSREILGLLVDFGLEPKAVLEALNHYTSEEPR